MCVCVCVCVCVCAYVCTISRVRTSLGIVILFAFPGCEMCHEERQSECNVHGPLHSLRKYVNGKPSNLRLSYAITSFPDEVQLCASSIPGAGYGVCAKQHIPVGTWIGPYEGRRIRPDDVIPGLDTSFMWEVNGLYLRLSKVVWNIIFKPEVLLFTVKTKTSNNLNIFRHQLSAKAPIF